MERRWSIEKDWCAVGEIEEIPARTGAKPQRHSGVQSSFSLSLLPDVTYTDRYPNHYEVAET
jgi:hypothetical protein